MLVVLGCYLTTLMKIVLVSDPASESPAYFTVTLRDPGAPKVGSVNRIRPPWSERVHLWRPEITVTSPRTVKPGA